MAQLYTSGPVPIWVGLGSGGAPVFLGHTERYPRISWRPRYGDAFCDLGGVMVPFEKVKQGTDAIISLDVIRFNESVFNLIAAATSRNGTVPGELGTLMTTEQGITAGAAYRMWLPFPYKQKPAMATMNAGYRFFSVMCLNDDFTQIGTMPLRKRMVFYAARSFALTSIGSALGSVGAAAVQNCGYFALCDNNVAEVSNKPID